jgi:flagellar biogenesis protein FliO
VPDAALLARSATIQSFSSETIAHTKETTMTITQILFVLWFVVVGIWLLNQFNKK